MTVNTASDLAAPVRLSGKAFLRAGGIGLSALGLFLQSGAVGAQIPAPDPADLDQRIRILERQLELLKEESATRSASSGEARFDERGLLVQSAKKDYAFRLRGVVHFDSRSYLGDEISGVNDTLTFRRVRPTFEGTFANFASFRLTPELAGDSTTLLDGWIDLAFSPAATLRVGKQKGPVGLERLVSARDLAMIERGFATELAPNRDIGAQLFGSVLGGTLSYGIGWFDGTVDGESLSSTNADDDFELAGRLFAEPFRNTPGFFQGLGFGVAGSSGQKEGIGNSFLPRYRTPAQNRFFQYRSSSSAATDPLLNVAADGDHLRLSPQGYFYRNNFGLLAEYITSEQAVVIGTDQADLEHSAWQVLASYVLTGEDLSYRSVAKPSSPVSPAGGGWGAWELVARYGELDVDDDSFPIFADPDRSATQSTMLGFGVNWYLTTNVKASVNYTEAEFDGGGAEGTDRDDERAVFGRLQLAW